MNAAQHNDIARGSSAAAKDSATRTGKTTTTTADIVRAPKYVMDFIKSKEKHIPTLVNHKGNYSLKTPLDKRHFPDFVITAPNPTIHHINSKRIPDPQDLYLWKMPIIFWLPHIFWFDYVAKSMKCPNPQCGQTKFWRTKGFHGPRLVRTLNGSGWLYSATLLCDDKKSIKNDDDGTTSKGCGMSWLSTTKEIIDALPDFVKTQCPFHLGERSAVSMEVKGLNTSLAPTNQCIVETAEDVSIGEPSTQRRPVSSDVGDAASAPPARSEAVGAPHISSTPTSCAPAASSGQIGVSADGGSGCCGGSSAVLATLMVGFGQILSQILQQNATLAVAGVPQQSLISDGNVARQRSHTATNMVAQAGTATSGPSAPRHKRKYTFRPSSAVNDKGEEFRKKPKSCRLCGQPKKGHGPSCSH